ncbi:AI-2E family transporter [Tepidamorphus sp. 3E244]|uniref:AI-2E family transporter n=1 Tax=Tepidamorphus sp. 3E244 TaxID=3385498 RepID=UPI0038FC2097
MTFSSRVALIATGLIVVIAAAYYARMLLAPITLAIVIGLMFGPVADRIERFGISSHFSAIVVLLAFILILAIALTSVVLPISIWIDRLPLIWQNIRSIMAEYNGIIESFSQMQDGMREIMGSDESMRVAVDDESPVSQVAWLAPTILAQILLFLASLYFFVVARNDVRAAILSICVNRRLRWRIARVFRDVEHLVSRYLLSITAINVGLGIAVGLAMWAAGVPSPYLWGLLAACLNYAIYVGPAVMAVIMLGVGLATYSGGAVLLPVAVYLSINMIEAQFVTPLVVGRSLTINPFLVFLALAFWLWLWGPVGGFIAVPMSLIFVVILRNLLPQRPSQPAR